MVFYVEPMENKIDKLILAADELIAKNERIIKYQQFCKLKELYENEQLPAAAKFALERSGMVLPYDTELTNETFNDSLSNKGFNLYENKLDGRIVNSGPVLDLSSGKLRMYKSDKKFAEDMNEWLKPELVIDGKGVGGGILGYEINEEKPVKSFNLIKKTAVVGITGILIASALSGSVKAERETSQGYIIEKNIDLGVIDDPSDNIFELTINTPDHISPGTHKSTIDRQINFYGYLQSEDNYRNLTFLDSNFHVGDAVEVVYDKLSGGTEIIGPNESLEKIYVYNGLSIEKISAAELDSKIKRATDGQAVLGLATAGVMAVGMLAFAYCAFKD
ncbi:MAG: hypothetical protein PHU12_00580 [Candidatus Aenigmarchaeota archaeon]|nr:hypothetical protein [Candidatus Aenigmarchaeota archaeon]